MAFIRVLCVLECAGDRHTNGHNDVCYGFVNYRPSHCPCVGRSMPVPVEHDNVLFPLVLCCSISRLQPITEKTLPLLSLFQALSMGTLSPPRGWPLASRPSLWLCGASSSECDVDTVSEGDSGCAQHWAKEFCLCSAQSSSCRAYVVAASMRQVDSVEKKNRS